MTADQYTELIDFLTRKFGRIDERFDALESRMDRIESRMDRIEGRMDAVEVRLTRVEVSLEAQRGDIQLVAEGLTTVNQRLDRYHQDHEVRIRALEAHWFEA